jgi:hypothetical protein
MKPRPLQENDSLSGPLPALGEAYAKAFEMLPKDRKRFWAEKISGRRAKQTPLAGGKMPASTSRRPLAR